MRREKREEQGRKQKKKDKLFKNMYVITFTHMYNYVCEDMIDEIQLSEVNIIKQK